jgi:hypothetical protein
LSAEEIAASSKSDPDVMEVDPPPPPVEEKSTNASRAASQQKRGVASVVKKPTEVVVINDRDLPSSTPLPPPLNVPIVTHSARPTEGKCILLMIGVHNIMHKLMKINATTFFQKMYSSKFIR